MLKNILNKIKEIRIYNLFYKSLSNNWLKLEDLKLASKVLQTMRMSRNPRPKILKVPQNKRIVILAPHPDDELIGLGGLVLKMIENNCKVSVHFITNGEKNEKGLLRKKEAKKVSQSLGYDFEFYDYEVYNIPNNIENGISLIKKINIFNPDILFTTFLLDDHDDHRRINELLFVGLKNGNLKCSSIWSYQVYSSIPGNSVFEITDIHLQKREAIKLYKSQNLRRDNAHFSLGNNAYSSRFLNSSSKARYCELINITTQKEYKKLCNIYFSNGPKKCYYTKNYIKE